MPDRLIHVQPLQRRLFAGHDHVHIVAAAQAVIGDGEQRVGIRRKIDAHDLALLGEHVIDESRILVAEAIVILPPDMRSQPVIERGNGAPPREYYA